MEMAWGYADPIAVLLVERDRYKPLFIPDTQLHSSQGSTSRHSHYDLLYSLARSRLQLATVNAAFSGLADDMADRVMLGAIEFVANIEEYVMCIYHFILPADGWYIENYTDIR